MAKVEKEMTMLRFTKRIPLEAYAFEEIEITETVAPENLSTRIDEIRLLVSGNVIQETVEADAEGVVEISLDGSDDSEEAIASAKEKVEAAEPKKRGRKPKATAAPVVADPEDEDDVDDDLFGGEPDEEEVEEEKPKKKVKKASTPYDRESHFHRKLISEMLTKEYPTWKKDPNKVKIVSKQMHGVDMIDGDGEVLPEFTAQFIKSVKAK